MGLAMKTELKTLAALFLALFVIGIIVGVTYLGFDYLKESMCVQADSTFVWSNGVCDNSTGDAQTVTTITKVGIVELAVDIALGLIGLVVLILIFAIIIKVALSFAKSTK